MGLETKDLDARTRCLVHHDASTHHARIVEYEHSALGQELCLISDVALGDGAVVVDEELRRRALLEWKLCYALIGERIVEVVDINMSLHSLPV